MNQQCRFSNVTTNYLNIFQAILDEMILGMTSASLTDSISHNFIVQMIPHHRAAIEMSRNLLRFTTNIPLQDIATRIITEQTKSIQDMLRIAAGCSQLKNSPQDLYLYQHRMRQIMKNMFADMRNAPASNDINISFIYEMVPHHKGAIAMSETTLDYPICPELVPILQAIIRSQKMGVEQMEKLLWYMTQSP